jgi:phosphoserine phosphatase
MGDRSLQRQIHELNTVLEVSRHLASTIELVPLLERIEQAALEVLDCERASVFLYDPATEELYSKVATGESEIRFSAKLGIAGDTVATRSVVNVPDAYADPRFNREIDRKTGYRTRSVLSVPLTGYDGSTVGVLQVLNKREGVFGEHDEAEGTVLGSLAGVAIQRQMLLDEYAEKQRLAHDLAIAREIQRSLLPTEDRSIAGYDIAGWNRPADETGGDCFDYVTLSDDRIGMLVADATGHGIGPALIVSECRALIRALAGMRAGLGDIMRRVNELLLPDLQGGRFVTAFLGVLDPHQHTVEYVSAGHGPLLHYRGRRDRVEAVGASTLPLGIVADFEGTSGVTIRMDPGDILIVVTDGFFEWANAADEQFGTERILDVVQAHRGAPARRIIEQLHRAVLAFAGGTPQADDLTAIILKRL